MTDTLICAGAFAFLAVLAWLKPEAGLMSSAIFGCRHKRTTFPVTRDGRCSVSCLNCGRNFEYSWKEMRRL